MHLSSDTLGEILAKLLEKGNAIGSIEVVQVYDIGDIDKTKLMIDRINEVLDELKYTKTRVVAMQTNQLAPLCTEGGQCKPSTQPL
ncbi:hypothetical protein BROOK1789C_1283 [Bathymodiolus brooksi thiotrophic gill symbiont]|nr:hypothetical protein BROOK1789C_1283 [Bathymodiolus brooksi thiotrophic gill symbiont]